MTKCIVVDDEQPARQLLALHLSTLQNCELLACFNNGIEAFNFLQKNQADLMFLDIQMPGCSGLELIRCLKQAPRIIITTAHREYAVEAFELDVVDYLVKPVTQERFMKALSKFRFQGNAHHELSTLLNSFDEAYIFFKTGKQQIKVYLKDILYFEALKDYIKIYTAKKAIVASERISYLEEKLPENRFARIHRSYIVSLEKISIIQAEQIYLGEIKLPIGRLFKKDFLRKLDLAQKKNK